MGCDIHVIAQKRNSDGEWINVTGNFAEGSAPFDWRSYGMFGFLAGVRNYSDITPISEPRGLPDGIEPDGDSIDDWLGDHSFSWLTIDELLAVDYNRTIEDRRYTKQIAPNFFNGAATCAAGDGKFMPLREFLGEIFMSDLAKLREIGAERIVFGFDS